MRKSKKVLKQIIAELEKMPNRSIACQRIGISRQTFYRWLEDDFEFSEAVDEAMQLGNESICDLAESKVVEKIKQGDLRAVRYYLDNKHRDYKRPRPDNWHHTDREKPSDNKVVFVDFSSGNNQEDDPGFYIG